MININKNKYIEITEEYLDENLPPDLKKAYRTYSYPSQRNPDTQHSDVHSGTRRSVLYDYGKATYKVISPAEAIKIIKNNKAEAQNLRILFQGTLVEYELRDNGSLYAIYRTADEIELNGNRYKNVGYAPWKSVIEAADKIYWTDEYEKKLSPEEIQKRDAKSIERIQYQPVYRGDPRYDPHRPNDNLRRNPSIHVKDIPDTGKHNKNDAIKIAYTDYSLARKALKKLEAEKDSYNSEEYEELKVKYEEAKQIALGIYEAKLASKRISDTKKVNEISELTHQFNLRINEYTEGLQRSLAYSYTLKQRLEQILTKTVNTDTGSNTYYRLARLRERIKDITDKLKNDITHLSDAKDDLTGKDKEEIVDVLTQIAEYKERYVSQHLDELIAVTDDLKKAEKEVDTYRVNTAVKKAKIAAEQTKDISPEVLNVIDFTNY